MQSRVDSILKGVFNENEHTLSFPTPVIILDVEEGERYEGSFEIEGPEGQLFEGTVSSDRMKMECPITEFSGSHIDIPFVFDASHLTAGECFKGEFRIISNQGEYYLPYEINIGSDSLNTSLGNICNLFHFTNLARTDWNEAVNLFKNDDFEKILSGVEAQYVLDHRLLKNGRDASQCLEEFLLRIRKKQPVEFIIEEPNIRIDSIYERTERTIVVSRNGWGYSKLEVCPECSFITFEKNFIEENDFIGNTARIHYSIVEEELHRGKNYGKVILKNAYNNIEITFCVVCNPINRKIAEKSRISKHHIVNLMEYYEAFRSRKISASTWMENTGEAVSKLLENEPDNPAFRMFDIQLLITSERYNEARWQLEQLEGKVSLKESEELYCYYYYLTTLLDRSEERTAQVADLVSQVFLNDRSKWRIAWLMMYLSDDYSSDPTRKWTLLKELCDRGCKSPVIYVEAYQILNNNPTILTQLGDFELNTLRYMATKDILTPEIIDQFVFLFGRSKHYDRRLLPLLEKCYAVSPTNDVLQAVCMLLINSNSTDKRAFSWYAKAIEKTLRITRLYEFYMNSIDPENIEEIPKMVLMYFSFDSNLDAYHNAILYSYVYRNKAIIPEIYTAYQNAIERFVMFQLLAGNNNKYLTYLYRNMLSEGMIMEDMAPGLAKALFAHEIESARDNIFRIVVNYENVDGEYEFKPSAHGKSVISVYGSGGRIMLEDNRGNRFVREEEYTLSKLMIPDKLARAIEGYDHKDELFDLWLCTNGSEMKKITEHNAESMRKLVGLSILKPEFKKQVVGKLLEYYYDNDKLNELDNLLIRLEMSDILSSDFASAVKLFVVRGQHEKALEWIKSCAGEGIDPKTILRLCGRMLSEARASGNFDYDAEMLSLVYRAFRGGKYETVVIEYLEKYFEGTSKEMVEVWKVAVDYGINTANIERRILEQLLYTGAYIPGNEVFFSFSQRRLDDRLSLAFLSQILYEYFVLDTVISKRYFEELKVYIDEDIEVPFVCQLAYTKFYAENLRLATEDIMRILVVFLKNISLEGIYFEYFRKYAGIVTNMHRFADKTMIEYKVKKGCTATIHYVIEQNGAEKEEYISKPMKDMYHGICVQDFVLFFGEKLQYYIIENDGENENLTISGTCIANEMDEKNEGNKYSLINDISISRTLGDLGTMDSLLNEYFRNEYLLDNMFTMMD